tara:strand:- start:17 stop:412 length:396 start_codon:yes stop_codon:yes gene_type:complete
MAALDAILEKHGIFPGQNNAAESVDAIYEGTMHEIAGEMIDLGHIDADDWDRQKSDTLQTMIGEAIEKEVADPQDRESVSAESSWRSSMTPEEMKERNARRKAAEEETESSSTRCEDGTHRNEKSGNCEPT